jgi:hypothetical protein
VWHNDELVARFDGNSGSARTEWMRWACTLRDRREFQVCCIESVFWVRVRRDEVKDAERIFSMLLGNEIFEIDSVGRLIRRGRKVPTEKLSQEMTWMPIGELLRLWLPQVVKADAQSSISPLPLRWGISEQILAPGAILCSLEDWSGFVLRNFQQRWKSLRFACNASSQIPLAGKCLNTLVAGTPVPNIPGVRLSCIDQILIPIPHCWVPGVPSEAVRRSLSLQKTEWLLWFSESSLEIIADHEWIATTRVSVRATVESMKDHVLANSDRGVET